jgi:branched-chain amino acid aminotransferase
VNQLAWIDGKLCNFAEAGLDAAGWPEGSGLFETVRTVDGKPWALSRHMRRALNSARRLRQPFPSEDLIRSAVSEAIGANPFAVGRLRIIFAKDGYLILTHQEYFEISSPAILGIKHSHVAGNQALEKRYPYTEKLELLNEAQQNGLDDYLLINRAGLITETAIANVVFQLNGDWVTPPLSDGVLPGVTRALLVEKAGVLVRQIKESDLRSLNSGFLVSSLKIAQPISQIGEQTLAISEESEQMRSVFAATALATSVG